MRNTIGAVNSQSTIKSTPAAKQQASVAELTESIHYLITDAWNSVHTLASVQGSLNGTNNSGSTNYPSGEKTNTILGELEAIVERLKIFNSCLSYHTTSIFEAVGYLEK